MKKIIPSKPGTNNSGPAVPDPFGQRPIIPFGRMTIEPEDRDSGIQSAMSAEADRLHPTSKMRRKPRVMS